MQDQVAADEDDDNCRELRVLSQSWGNGMLRCMVRINHIGIMRHIAAYQLRAWQGRTADGRECRQTISAVLEYVVMRFVDWLFPGCSALQDAMFSL